ncbi:hypothetical protein ACOSQ2_005079 [Xanthoceras sorbifolium]
MSKDKSDIFLVRFNGKNYSTWEFHFKVFVKDKDLWGHIDDNKPPFDAQKEKALYAIWEVKDAQVMTWILGFVKPHLVLHLRSSKTAAEMWTYLKKVYCQNNMARRF